MGVLSIVVAVVLCTVVVVLAIRERINKNNKDNNLHM
jgi:hypothetical protein